MKAKDEDEDLATWRIMSSSTEDTKIMLGVMDMAYSGEFRWNMCPPPITLLANEHAKLLSPQRALDSPNISNLIGIPISSSEPESTQLTQDLRWDLGCCSQTRGIVIGGCSSI
jgi:hypothetical protein